MTLNKNFQKKKIKKLKAHKNREKQSPIATED